MPEIKSDTTSEQRKKEYDLNRQLTRGLDDITTRTRQKYESLLTTERRNHFDPNRPGLVTISTQRRLELLEMAKSEKDIKSLTKEIESEKKQLDQNQDSSRQSLNKAANKAETPHPFSTRSGYSYWGNANAGFSEPKERDD